MENQRGPIHLITLILAGNLIVNQAASAATEIAPYGFIKASGIASSRAVESFGNANLSAPIRAFPSDAYPQSTTRTSFQVAQSRIGINIGKNNPVTGQLELDFIDFDKATPGTKALPRLRVATIKYAPDADNTFILGQDWDVFSPTKPFTFNYVGLYFGAGNAGFMRPQLKWAHSMGKVKLETGVGLAGSSNSTATDGDVERAVVPSVAASVTIFPDDESKVGLSSLAGRLHLSAAGQEQLGGFYGVNAFFERSFGSVIEVRAELYYGENLANSGVLTSALGAFNETRHEWGGYLTLKSLLFQSLSGQFGIGYVSILEDNGSTIRNVPGFRVLENLKLSGSLAYHLAESVDLFFEMTAFHSRFLEEATGERVSRFALLAESGAVYTF